MADDYLPSPQLGVQAFGSFYTPSWELGYHAYVGNNRTPSQVDFTDDKTLRWSPLRELHRKRGQDQVRRLRLLRTSARHPAQESSSLPTLSWSRPT